MILEVNNGSFAYGDRTILDNISFQLADCQVMTVLGPNGVGKTTLLRCVMGFLSWKTGETRVAGRSLKSYKEKELWQIVSYVPQAKRNVFSYRVLDMVVMGLDTQQSYFNTPKQEHYERAHEMLRKMGIAQLCSRHCHELSGGEFQMVMIARALVSNPTLLILDEPESNLDMKNQLRVLGAIEQAAKEMQTACLINTHFPNHALNISDQTLFLGENLRLFGPSRELITEENVERFFKVRSKIVSFQAEEQDYRTIFPYKISTAQRSQSKKSV